MALGKRLINTGGAAACLTDTTDIFGDSSGVALYSLDYDASDESGNYDGAPTNVDFGVGGQINYGARFNGSSSYIDSNLQMPSTTTFTFSCWFNKNNSSANYHLIGDFDSSGTLSSGRFRIQLDSSDNISVGVGNGTNMDFSVFTPSVSLNNVWRHIAVTIDGTSVKAYIDGSQVGTTDTSLYSLTSGVNDFAIGAYHPASGKQNFDGDIDQVRIFSKALSQSEIDTLYAETACVYTCTTDTVDFPTTNVAYYKLDNSAEDETGSYDGTESNIEYRFGRFGQAAVFNGSSSKIELPNTSLGITDASNFSISYWFNTNSTTQDNQSVIWANGSNAGARFGSGINSTSLGGDTSVYFGMPIDGTFTYINSGTSAFTANTWVHVVCVKSSTTGMTLYVDNVSKATNTSATGSGSATSTGKNSIGMYHTSSDSSFFNGKIDQVRIFSTALDSDQVSQLYNEKPCEDTSNFKTVLYEGNNSTQYISNVGFQPDLVWVKSRDSSSYDHNLYDSVRGELKRIKSNTTSAEDSNGKLSSFDANGFSLIAGGDANASGQSMVAWCWKGSNADAVSNTDGSITSQVSANTDAGFSIVDFSNTTTNNVTVGHGLDLAPELIIIKSYSDTGSWQVYAEPIGATKRLRLQTTEEAQTFSTFMNDTAPTTDVFTIGDTGFWGSNRDFIAYCFHSVSGYSKIGSFVGDGSTDTVLNLSFEPKWIMIKNTNTTTGWFIMDFPRDNFAQRLKAEVNNIESSIGTLTTSPTGITISSNSSDGRINGRPSQSDTMIYMAFK